MEALFIGHPYIDMTIVTDHVPSGDEKYVAQDYAFGIGGNAVVAAFTAAQFGVSCDLAIPVAEDRLGDILMQRCARRGIRVFPRKVRRSSLSLVLPNDGKRAILRSRDTDYLEDFPMVHLEHYGVVHVDGHQPQAALHHVKAARERGILTSLDGGTVRETTDEILEHTDVAVVAERFCEVLGITPEDTIDYLIRKGVKVPAVTLGVKGMLFVENGDLQELPAIPVPPEEVLDTTGAGDIFHGAYVFSYLRSPDKSWREHFAFARAASALSVRTLGAENSIPHLADVDALVASVDS